MIKYKSLLLISICLSVSIQQQNCGFQCVVCKIQGQCVCKKNYVYNKIENICESKCQYGQYLQCDQYSDCNCVSICDYGKLNDTKYKTCMDIEDCPVIREHGQGLHDQFQDIIISYNYYITIGRNDKNLKLFDKINFIQVGDLSNHDDPVLKYHLIREKLGIINFEAEYLLSMSAHQLVKWNLYFGQIIWKLQFPPYLSGTHYIILVHNTRLRNEFSVIFLSQLYEDASNPEYHPFQSIHTNTIRGFIVIENSLFSYGDDGNFIQWDLEQNMFIKVIFSQLNKEILKVIYNVKRAFIMQFKGDNQFFLTIDNIVQAIDTKNFQPIVAIFQSKEQLIENSWFDYLFMFSKNTIYMQKYTSSSQIILLTKFKIVNEYRFILNDEYIFTSTKSGLITLLSFSQDGIKIVASYNFNLKYMNYFSKAILDRKYNRILIAADDLLVFDLNISLEDSKNNSLSLNYTIGNISKNKQSHTLTVRGMFIEPIYNRIVSYSIDGSIRIWDDLDSFYGKYNLVIIAYHPDCDLLISTTCSISIIKCVFANQNLIVCQYLDNSIIIWKYELYSLTLINLLYLENQEISLNNIFIYQNQLKQTSFLVYSNRIQLTIYDLNEQGTFYLLNGDFRYQMLEFIQSKNVWLLVYLDSKHDLLCYCELQYCNQKKSIEKFEIKGSPIFIEYFPSARNLVFTTNMNRLYFFFIDIFKYEEITVSTINSVIYIPTIGVERYLLFYQNMTAQFFQMNQTSHTFEKSYSFSGQVLQGDSIVDINSGLFLFFQNTASTIENQVFGFEYNFLNSFILQFEDKISSLLYDDKNNKLYVGFENGKIYQGMYTPFKVQNQYIPDNYPGEQELLFQNLYYSPKLQKIYSFTKEIYEIDCFSLKMKQLSYKHGNQIQQMILDDQNNQILTYDIQQGIGTTIVLTNTITLDQSIYQNNISVDIIKLYLITKNDILIAYQKDFNFIIWKYSSKQLIRNWTYKKEQKVQFNLNNKQEDLQIIQVLLDEGQSSLFILDSKQNLIVYDYIKNTIKSQMDIPFCTNIFLDTDPNSLNIVATVYSDNQGYLKIFNSSSLQFFKEKKFHIKEIKNVVFQSTYVFSVEDTLLVIMNRKTYEKINQISSTNPLIIQFIFFEKMNQIYVYEDYSKDRLNYRIAVFNSQTGEKITDILNNLSIQNGNISKVYLDEENYQLFIFKSLEQFCFTVDARTFKYTGYIITQFKQPTLDFISLRESNSVVIRDSQKITQFYIILQVQQNGE